MVGMTDIAQFLAARLDEDEERAELAQSVIAGSWDGWGVIAPQLHACCDTVPNIDRAGQHLYVNADPARVRADVAAKRALLKRLEADVDGCTDDAEWRGASTALDRVLEYLAAPYDSHPDYDPAWRVPTTEENDHG